MGLFLVFLTPFLQVVKLEAKVYQSSLLVLAAEREKKLMNAELDRLAGALRATQDNDDEENPNKNKTGNKEVNAIWTQMQEVQKEVRKCI